VNKYIPTPIEDKSNQNNQGFACNPGGSIFDTGSLGYISLYFTRPFVGQVTIPPTVIQVFTGREKRAATAVSP
jgi:hypothetical protein